MSTVPLWEILIGFHTRTYKNITIFRVATAQGKQGIWFLLFPDRENTGNFAFTRKNSETQGKYFSVTQGKNLDTGKIFHCDY